MSTKNKQLNTSRAIKVSLTAIGIFGLLIFGSLFTLTFGVPQVVEESAKSFVKKQIEREVQEKYQASAASGLADKAMILAGELGYEEQRLTEDISNKLPEKIAEVIATMCGLDCERKKVLTQSITRGYMERIAGLQVAQYNLGQIIKDKYLEIAGNLKTDLRIFLGSNAAMFLILLVIATLKPQAVAHLFLPGILLLLSTLAASAIYLFGQDWFYTILYNDYVGFGYLGYIGLIFGFLMDVALNKARVTTEIINGIFNLIGSAFSVVPC